MRILVIGGGGFIGSHLINDMVAAGHMVTALGRKPEPFRPLPPDVKYVSGSLDDRNLLRQLVAESDAVAHLASATVPTTGDKNPVADVQANLIGTLNLLDAMGETGCDRLLYLSSGGTVYGVPQSTPINELHPLAPVCSYGIVKVAIETYLNLYARTSRLRPITIRASNPYGPFQGNVGIQGIIGTYLNRALNHQPIEIWGDGSTIRDFIFVPDLTRLCLSALESNMVGIYNGGTGYGTSIKEIAALVQETTGQKIPVLYRPGRKLDVPISVLDITKAQTDFGWSPAVNLREGISRTWANLEHESRIVSRAKS